PGDTIRGCEAAVRGGGRTARLAKRVNDVGGRANGRQGGGPSVRPQRNDLLAARFREGAVRRSQPVDTSGGPESPKKKRKAARGVDVPGTLCRVHARAAGAELSTRGVRRKSAAFFPGSVV